MQVCVTVNCDNCETSSCQPCPPAPPAAKTPETMIAVLNPLGQGNFGQPATMFDAQIVKPSEDAELNFYGSSIKYKSNGWYTVSLTCKVEPVNGNDDVYPYGVTVYGSHVTLSLEGRSNHARYAEPDDGNSQFANDPLRNDFGTESQKVQWHDDFTVKIEDFEGQESAIIMYAQKYAGGLDNAKFSGVLKVTKISDLTA